MKVVWTLETATVRDVYEHLRSRRTIAYTTVLTMMKILEQKGYVRKTREERAFKVNRADHYARSVRVSAGAKALIEASENQLVVPLHFKRKM